MDVRGRRDGQIDGPPTRLPATSRDGRREPPPFACHCGVDGQRLEGGLDDAEPLGASSPLVRVDRHEYAEVQLRQRRDADPALDVARAPRADENRGIEEDPHLA